MSLTLHFHPLSSFCQKVLIGFYELDVPFRRQIVDLMDHAQRAAFVELWPMGKFPVLRDEARGVTVPESSIVLEYVGEHYAKRSLVPSEPNAALECRLRDRFFDLYVNVPLGKIVTDKLRPKDLHDPLGVEHARAQLETAYSIANEWLREGPWAGGEVFTLADCAAAPSLFYAKQVIPFGDSRQHLARYFDRVCEHPAVARVMDEAKPYLSMFPG